jgi:muconolactone delta-isomerase
MMKYWEVALDVDTVYRTRVEADTVEEARDIAEQEAYEDTWSTAHSWGGCTVYDIDQVTAEGLPLEED